MTSVYTRLVQWKRANRAFIRRRGIYEVRLLYTAEPPHDSDPEHYVVVLSPVDTTRRALNTMALVCASLRRADLKGVAVVWV